MSENKSAAGESGEPKETTIDSRALRHALGSFATGVTIVATRNNDGQDIGVTANSFNSVSLDPPLVLWSLSRKSLSLPSFQQSPYFAVHVLSADQDNLSQLFATQGANKFRDLAVERGFGEVPLIDGCAAVFQCRTAFSYDAGDHIIFVGEVLAFAAFRRPPLLFHAGSYALAVEKKAPLGNDQTAAAATDPGHEFLFGLLGRAHNQIYRGIQSELGLGAMSAEHLSVLSLLGKSSAGSAADVAGEASPDSGQDAASRLVDAVRSVEKQSGCNLESQELLLLKQLLRKLLGEGTGSR